MTVTNYDKLVAALRYCSETPEEEKDCNLCDYYPKCSDVIAKEAADAIEALQAEKKKTVTQIFWEEQLWWETRCKELEAERMELIAKCRRLQAQLPKRGEWIYKPKDAIEMMFTLPKCSVCGHESSDANNYCPRCGAKMNGEVEHGEKNDG